MLIISALAIALLINASLFAIAYTRQSDKLTDFAYSISFITITVAILAFADQRSTLLVTVCTLVLIWALRLGGFLVYRIRKSGKDRRFDSIRSSFIKFLEFWLGQGLVAWLLLLPVIFLSDHAGDAGTLTYIGLAAWLAGFMVESVADLQKYRFKQNPNNKNKWIDSGVWHFSRHPNYFGEILLWIGIYLIAFSSLNNAERLVSLLSPLSIIVSLLFISGIPLLEKSADTRWGADKDYRAYKQKTPLLVPFWPKSK